MDVQTKTAAIDQQVRRRAACDECRTKKLKCSGDQPSCARCMREAITCVYSPQKQMGRPKKRQRSEHEPVEENMSESLGRKEGNASEPQWMEPANDFSYMNLAAEGNPSMDLSGLDTAFTSDGTLQPWMLPVAFGQDSIVTSEHGFDNAVPGLTPDTSSHNSPPSQNMSHTMNQTSHTPHDNASNPPSVNGQLLTCACLSTLYLTLSNLSTMDSSFSFPTALHPLREAMSTASEVISCEVCPTRFITGLQNVQLLNALLMSLAERFSRILSSITAEAASLESHNALAPPNEQKTKTFRLADLSTPGHLHTGGLNCAAAFSLSFTPSEWRSMAKKVVRAEVHGPQDGVACCPYLLGLIAQMEKRQDRWHKAPPSYDYPRDKEGNLMPTTAPPAPSGDGHAGEGASAHGKGEHLCLKMLAGTRRMVEGFDWS